MTTKNTSLNATGEPTSKEWENLQLEQMQLNIKQLKLDIEIRESDIKHKQLQNLCDKIEQARRNVEVLSKVEHLIEEELVNKKILVDALKTNLEVLSEVVNIK